MDENLLPVHYAFRALTECESKYSVYKLEFLACLYGVETFRAYLKIRNLFCRLITWLLATFYTKRSCRVNLVGILLNYRNSILILSTFLHVADPLSRMFEEEGERVEDEKVEGQEVCLATMSFPEFFHSLPDKQSEELNRIIEQIER